MHSPVNNPGEVETWAAGGRSILAPSSPAQLRDIAYQNKRVIYHLLMKAAAETTLTIAADPKHLAHASASPPCCTPGARP
jgi:hypothetical protein